MKSLMGGAPKPQPVVIPPPPPPIPLPDDEANRKAKKKSIAKQVQQSGRAATMMTANNTIAGEALGAG
jgi:hypothetical protein